MTRYLLPSLLGSLALATVACAEMDSDEAASASTMTQGVAAAEEGSGEARGRRGHRRGPPQQAIDACADASAGDECSFENRRGDAMQGNCTERRRGGEGLACRPEGHGRRGHRRGPPQQSIDACADASAGDECSFENRRGDAMSGNCVEGRRGGEGLHCRPEGHGGPGHARRGHRRGPPQQAIDACADASAGDECSFESRRRGDMQGNCVDHPRLDGLVCRPEGHRGRGPHGPGPDSAGR